MRVVFEQLKTGFEDRRDYRPRQGDFVGGRYRVDDFIGDAAFSATFACVDLADEAQGAAGSVCLKIIKNKKDFFDQSLDEIKLLRYLCAAGDVDAHHVVKLVDCFYFKEHLVLVTDLLLENLHERARQARHAGVVFYNVANCSRIARQCLIALKYVHSLGITHCDVKPENVVLSCVEPVSVKLIDFGSSCFSTDKAAAYVQSRSYRAPEVLLGLPYDAKIDIWSLGCVLAEIFAGYVLLQNDSVASMLARMQGILGPVPRCMRGADAEQATMYFNRAGDVFARADADSDGEARRRRGDDDSDDEASPSSRFDSRLVVLVPKRTTLAARLHLPQDEPFVHLIQHLLAIDPSKRPDADRALQHAFFHEAPQ